MGNHLQKLLDHPQIWQGRRSPHRNRHKVGIETGYPALDEHLPQGGWCPGALTEILYESAGCGEITLLLPTLARLSRRGQWIAWIAPPSLPYPPALKAAGVDLKHCLLVHPRKQADRLWAVEQAMRSGTCAAVVTWPRSADPQSIRRLQLAAEAGQCWGVLIRPARDKTQSSPAALRLLVRASTLGTQVEVLKSRGALPHRHALDLPVPAAFVG